VTPVEIAHTWALAGWAIVCVAVLDRLVLTPLWRRGGRGDAGLYLLRGAAALLALSSALWPGAGITWAMQLRGTLGNLSVLPVAAALLAWWPTWSTTATARADRLALAWFSVPAGAWLVTEHLVGASAAGSMDLYRLGYTGWTLPMAVALAGLLAALAGWWRTALCLAAVLLMWGLGVPESTNLWDALVDPLWALWCLGTVVSGLINRRTARVLT
jgi:hypothetical protein